MDTGHTNEILVNYHKLSSDDHDDWTRVQSIGKGAYGVVWLESHRRDPTRTRAVKQVARRPSTSQNHYEELIALIRFSRPRYEKYFAQCLGWYEKTSGMKMVIYMTMEYFKLGDLRKHMTPQRSFPEVECRKIIKQLLTGLRVMHDERVSHRDIKPENIFVVNDAPDWWIKIGDFGISKRARNNDTKHSTLRGSFLYMAPEIFSHSSYTNAVDIWAAGVLTYELLTGVQPFGGSSSMQHPLSGLESQQNPLQINGVSLDGHKFVQELLSVEPSSRPTASEALSRDWFSLPPSRVKQETQGYQRTDSPNISTLMAVVKSERTSSRKSFVSEELASWTTTLQTKTQTQAQAQAQILKPALKIIRESVHDMSALPRPATSVSLKQPQCEQTESLHMHMDIAGIAEIDDRATTRQASATRSTAKGDELIGIQSKAMTVHPIGSLQVREARGDYPSTEGYLLYEAIAAKDLRQVRRLMNQGYPSNLLIWVPRKPWIRTTPLTAAISVGAFEIAVVLLENKADPNGRYRDGLGSQEAHTLAPLTRLCEGKPWSQEAIQMASILVAHGAKVKLLHLKITFDRLDRYLDHQTRTENLGMLSVLYASWSYDDLPTRSCDTIILLCRMYRSRLPNELLLDWLVAHVSIATEHLQHIVHTVMGLRMHESFKCEWLKEIARISETDSVRRAISNADCASETARSVMLRSLESENKGKSKQALRMDCMHHHSSSKMWDMLNFQATRSKE